MNQKKDTNSRNFTFGEPSSKLGVASLLNLQAFELIFLLLDKSNTNLNYLVIPAQAGIH